MLLTIIGLDNVTMQIQIGMIDDKMRDRYNPLLIFAATGSEGAMAMP